MLALCKRMRFAVCVLVVMGLAMPGVLTLFALQYEGEETGLTGMMRRIDYLFKRHCFFRDELTGFAIAFHYRALKVSPTPKVALGKDGWLFYINPGDGNALHDVRKSRIDSPERLALLARKLTTRRDELRRMGAEYVLVLAPNKTSVYPEYLPSALGYRGISRLDVLAAYLAGHTDLYLVNAKTALLAAKNDLPHPLYARRHSAWNAYGAFAGYRALGHVLQDRYPGLRLKELSEFRPAVDHEIQDLDRILGVPGMAPLPEPTLKGDAFAHVEFRQRLADRPFYHQAHGANRNAALPRTLAFGDCFMPGMGGFLADQCESFTAYHVLIFDIEQAQKEKPGLVIHEIVERYLDHLWE